MAKIFPIVDLDNGQDLFDEIKIHYAHMGDNSKMTLGRLAKLCTSRGDAFEHVFWFRIWNSIKKAKRLASFPIDMLGTNTLDS